MLNDTAYPNISSGEEREVSLPNAMRRQAFADLQTVFQKQFPVQDPVVWIPLIGIANKGVDALDSELKCVRSSFMKKPQTFSLEYVSTLLWMTKRRVYLDLLVKWLATQLNLARK